MVQAKAAANDSTKFIPEATGAEGPPGFELLMEPVATWPAEQELDETTTEKAFDEAFSVVLKVTPLRIKVCAPAAVVGPEYVKAATPALLEKGSNVATPQVPIVPAKL